LRLPITSLISLFLEFFVEYIKRKKSEKKREIETPEMTSREVFFAEGSAAKIIKNEKIILAQIKTAKIYIKF
jgi:hypothetical protein